jgi:hypothetical protein
MSIIKTALASDQFRNTNISNFIEDSLNPLSKNKYYVFLGKSTSWDLNGSGDEIPDNPAEEEKEYYFNRTKKEIVSLKAIKTNQAELTFFIERINWVAGTTYNFWDPHSATNTNFYVLTNNLVVYKCISAPNTASVIEPIHFPEYNKETGAITNAVNIYADGYVWQFMYQIREIDAETYLTNNFMPFVKSIDPTDINFQIQKATNLNRRILGFKFDATQGFGESKIEFTNDFNQNFELDVFENGNRLLFKNIPVGGNVPYENFGIGNINPIGNLVYIEDDTDGSLSSHVKPLISPGGGHAFDPAVELSGIFAGIGVKFDDNDFPEIPKTFDIRQIGIIRNPAYNNGPQNLFKTGNGAVTGTNLITLTSDNDFVFYSENVEDYFVYNATENVFPEPTNVTISSDGKIATLIFSTGVADGDACSVNVAQSIFDQDKANNLVKLIIRTGIALDPAPWRNKIISDDNETKFAFVAAAESEMDDDPPSGEGNQLLILYIVQNQETEFVPFEENDDIKFEGLSGTVSVNQVIEPDIFQMSGEILFLENRSKIERQQNQIEDFRITIEF